MLSSFSRMINGNGMLSSHTNYAAAVEQLKILSNMLLKASHVCLFLIDIEGEQRKFTHTYDEYERIHLYFYCFSAATNASPPPLTLEIPIDMSYNA